MPDKCVTDERNTIVLGFGALGFCNLTVPECTHCFVFCLLINLAVFPCAQFLRLEGFRGIRLFVILCIPDLHPEVLFRLDSMRVLSLLLALSLSFLPNFDCPALHFTLL